MKNNIAGVYEIRNTVNGHQYIGSSVNIARRWRDHRRELNRNKHFNQHLQSAWNKYGKDNFVFGILIQCDRESTLLYEQEALDNLQPEYNISENVTKPTLGLTTSDETKAKLSAALAGENSPNYGKHFSDETKAKMSMSQKGRLFSDEHRAKLSAAQKAYWARRKAEQQLS